MLKEIDRDGKRVQDMARSNFHQLWDAAFVKQAVTGDALGEFTVTTLLKYDYLTQDKLAKVAIRHQLTKRQATKGV